MNEICNQFGRRNLLPFQRSELALKMKETIKAKAKANQQGSQGGILLLQKSEKASSPTHTDEEVSKLAGVSRFTIRQAETILKDGTPEQQERARICINRSFSCQERACQVFACYSPGKSSKSS